MKRFDPIIPLTAFCPALACLCGQEVRAAAPQQAPLPADEMAPGSVIRRLFKGRYHEVTVLGEGRFAYDGEVFDNLTAIAWKICGYRKSGNAFFNLPMKSRA